MLLLNDKCSYNYHYFFFNLKSFKGLKLTQLELTIIYFLWWTQKQHRKWPFYDPFSPGELKIEKKTSGWN